MYPVNMMEMLIYLSCVCLDKHLKVIQRDKKGAKQKKVQGPKTAMSNNLKWFKGLKKSPEAFPKGGYRQQSPEQGRDVVGADEKKVWSPVVRNLVLGVGEMNSRWGDL